MPADAERRLFSAGRDAFGSEVRDGRAHTIEARLAGPDTYLRGTPAVINCPREEAVK